MIGSSAPGGVLESRRGMMVYGDDGGGGEVWRGEGKGGLELGEM